MVNISPFQGLVYNKKKAGDLSSLISPPYDVISGDLRKKLTGSAHHNIVNLIPSKDIEYILLLSFFE